MYTNSIIVFITLFGWSDPPATQPAGGAATQPAGAAAIQPAGGAATQPATESIRSVYLATLESKGGRLPFVLELETGGAGDRAWIINGPERIEVPQATITNDSMHLDLSHYDATLDGRRMVGKEGPQIYGEWRRRTGTNTWSVMGLEAVEYEGHRFPPLATSTSQPSVASTVTGRWSFQFGKQPAMPAVARFEQDAKGEVVGTIMTQSGDYRYLSGTYEAGRLRLSSFDGGQAYLLDGKVGPHGAIEGGFWSRDTYHDTWKAERDDKIALANGFDLAKAKESVDWTKIVLNDLDGKPVELGGSEFKGRPMVIEVFGTWCPNCHDSAELLAELDRRYRGRGLRVIGVGFELSADPEHDRELIRQFAKRHKLEHLMCYGGTASRTSVGQVLPVVENYGGFPTTIFVGANGVIRGVHTGFSGPATGPHYDELRKEFTEMIDGLFDGGSGRAE